MNIKLFRNQGEAGGGAIAAPSSNPSPSVAAPSGSAGGASQSSGGESAYERFQSQLAGLTMKTDQTSQPTGNGNNGDAQASESQGDADGSQTDDQSTTDDLSGDSTAEEVKGAQEQWSEEELKGLKDHGLEDMPYHPSARKLMQSNRELRTRFDQVSASNANAITEAETIRQAAYAAASGNVKALQDALGLDFKLNQRTHDDQLKEFGQYHGEQLSVLQNAITRFEGAGQMEIAQALLDVGNRVLGLWNDKVKTVQAEKEWQDRENKLMQKFGKSPDPAEAYKGMSQKAQNHLASLTAEDPKAAEYFNEIKAATEPGGTLRALGIDLARAFGTNIQTARQFLEFGKAMHVLKNQNQILATERKRWEADQAKRSTQSGTRGTTTGGQSGRQSAPNAAVQNLAAQMSAFMGRR